jgi:hypothetical protein
MRKKSLSLICIITFLLSSIQMLSAKNNRGITCDYDTKSTCAVLHFPDGDVIVQGKRKSKPI